MCLYLRDKIEHIATSNIYVWKWYRWLLFAL